jgi:hypothetical protein
MGDLALKSRDETRLIHWLIADMRIEVAIGAFRQAKGPMNIDPEARMKR